jgi:hypothetical protein
LLFKKTRREEKMKKYICKKPGRFGGMIDVVDVEPEQGQTQPEDPPKQAEPTKPEDPPKAKPKAAPTPAKTGKKVSK